MTKNKGTRCSKGPSQATTMTMGCIVDVSASLVNNTMKGLAGHALTYRPHVQALGNFHASQPCAIEAEILDEWPTSPHAHGSRQSQSQP